MDPSLNVIITVACGLWARVLCHGSRLRLYSLGRALGLGSRPGKVSLAVLLGVYYPSNTNYYYGLL